MLLAVYLNLCSACSQLNATKLTSRDGVSNSIVVHARPVFPAAEYLYLSCSYLLITRQRGRPIFSSKKAQQVMA